MLKINSLFAFSGGESTESGICPRGYYCPEGTELATQYGCPNGTFNANEGITSEGDCQYCEQGRLGLDRLE